MAFRRVRRRMRKMYKGFGRRRRSLFRSRRKKNLKRGTFGNKLYKKGVSRGLHTAGKFIAKTRKPRRFVAKILHKKATRTASRRR